MSDSETRQVDVQQSASDENDINLTPAHKQKDRVTPDDGNTQTLTRTSSALLLRKLPSRSISYLEPRTRT